MEKFTTYLILSVATGLGSYLPTWLGAGLFSGWSILGGFVGGLIGVYIIYRLR